MPVASLHSGTSQSQNALPSRAYYFRLFGWGNRQIETLSIMGTILSSVLITRRVRSIIIPLLLWLLYLSFYSVATLPGVGFWHYGWDFQLLETGFLAIFLESPSLLRPVECSKKHPEKGTKYSEAGSTVIIWCFRWLAFRVMLGAGLSKVRAQEPCWTYDRMDCLAYHYQTTGNPTPMAWLLHRMPLAWHWAEVAANHVTELVLPWLLICPFRFPRLLAASAQIVFQAILVFGGNYAFLNHLTCVPLIACFDDTAIRSTAMGLRRFTRKFCRTSETEAPHEEFFSSKIQISEKGNSSSSSSSNDTKSGSWLVDHARGILHVIIALCVAVLIAYKSRAPLRNLFGPHPWLKTFDDLYLVNSYGVFGTITKRRLEIVLEFSVEENPGPKDWQEMEFYCKPDVVTKIPCATSPYYHRLDWETWIDVTAMENPRLPPYLQKLAILIMEGDIDVANLVRTEFSTRLPKYFRPIFYEYFYSKPVELFQNQRWWRRILIFEGDVLRNTSRVIPYTGRDPVVFRGRDGIIWLAALGLGFTGVHFCSLQLSAVRGFHSPSRLQHVKNLDALIFTYLVVVILSLQVQDGSANRFTKSFLGCFSFTFLCASLFSYVSHALPIILSRDTTGKIAFSTHPLQYAAILCSSAIFFLT